MSGKRLRKMDRSRKPRRVVVTTTVDPEIKAKAIRVINEKGYSVTKLVNVVLQHIIRTGKLPFPVMPGSVE